MRFYGLLIGDALEVLAMGSPQAQRIKDPVRLFLITRFPLASRINCIRTVLVGFKFLRDSLFDDRVLGVGLWVCCCRCCCINLVIFPERLVQVNPKRGHCCCVRPHWWLDQKGGRRREKDKEKKGWLFHDDCCYAIV